MAARGEGRGPRSRAAASRRLLLPVGALALGLALVRLAGCGSSTPVCGNGVTEDGEDCDNGAQNGAAGSNCSADCRSVSVKIPQLQVRWGLFKKTGVTGYGGAGCGDVGAETAHVQLAGPTPADQMLPCLNYSQIFSDKLAEGSYTATVTLLDKDGNALTKAATVGPMAVKAGAIVDFSTDFEAADFTSALTGSFQVRVGWGADGVVCGNASPPVDQQTYRLVPDGQSTPVAGKATIAGTPLDGSSRAACWIPDQPPAMPYYEEARDLPVGAYDLTVEGYSGGQLAYCGAQTIFIGPGSTNMGWAFVVPAVGTDAGACP